MTEVLVGHDIMRSPLDPGKVSEGPIKDGAPRSEFFLMTGDKMISLNHKISPRYAEMYCEQLPPTTEKAPASRVRKPFDDFVSAMPEKSRAGRFNPESAVPASQSENGLHEKERQQDFENDGKNSSVTVNLDRNNSSNLGEANGSIATVSSSCSNGVAPQNAGIEHQNGILERSREISGNESNCFVKSPVALMNDFVPTVRCPSSDYDRKSEFDNVASTRLAKRLFTLDGFKQEDVATHLSKTNEFGTMVAEEYCALFNFSGIRLDAAMREFLSRFCLTGETQERARIIEHFANRYHKCNPTLFKSADQVHALACALLLLNSDLHGPNIGRRMSCRNFVDNLSQTEHVFDCALLKILYKAIKEQPIKWAGEFQEASGNGMSTPNDTDWHFHEKKKKALSKSRLNVDEDDQIEYKAGWVMRKCLFDRDGKRTPFGRRSWKMVYARLRGMVLYLHKDENGFSHSRFQSFNNAILLHHALAEKPKDYNKRQHVFKLRTANLGETLFQTSGPNEVQQWVDTINYVAAAFSSPALPAPVSNQFEIFHKPLLPSAPSRLSIIEQLRAHEGKEEEMQLKLDEVMKTAPSLNSKGHVVQDFFYKERYLYLEKERYHRYVNVLREHLSTISLPHSLSLRFEPTLRKGQMEDAGCFLLEKNNLRESAKTVQEQPNGEAKAMKFEDDFEIESGSSSTSTGPSSYQEAIQQNRFFIS